MIINHCGFKTKFYRNLQIFSERPLGVVIGKLCLMKPKVHQMSLSLAEDILKKPDLL